MQEIKISQILDDLNRGLTRTTDTPGYNPELGCIMDKYGLSKKELDYLFDHKKLKNKKTKLPVFINIIDDTEDEEEDTLEVEATEVVNNANIDPEIFGNDWEKEIIEAREIQKQALTNKD